MEIGSIGSPTTGNTSFVSQAQMGVEKAQAENHDVQTAVSVEMLKKAIDIQEGTMQTLISQMGDIIPPSSKGLVNLLV